MYRALALILTALPLGAAELTIDHVTAAGKDLKTMQVNLAAIGLECEYGGLHQNQATEMALVSFRDGSYLELIAPRTAAPSHPWGKYMEGNAGPCAWAVRGKDMAAEAARLKAARVAVSEPRRSGRARPDGKRLDWETVQVGQEPNGTFFPFLIRDFTPRKDRAFLKGKPTTKDFSGVTRVIIAVRDLQASIDRYREAYALDEPIKQVDKRFGAYLALMGSAPVILAAPLNAQSWLAARLDEFGEGPCAFILGARKTHPAASKTRWFGADISWFDAEKLGWHLGFE